MFLLYTIGMNAIPGAFAVAAAATHWRNDCDKNLALWLVVTAVVFNLFMIGLYLPLWCSRIKLCRQPHACNERDSLIGRFAKRSVMVAPICVVSFPVQHSPAAYIHNTISRVAWGKGGARGTLSTGEYTCKDLNVHLRHSHPNPCSL